MTINPDKNTEEEIIEQSIFGDSPSQFRAMLKWLKLREGFELSGKITGVWTYTSEFFKGEGVILKKYDGKVFDNAIYILIGEANIGREDILIGRRILEIQSRKLISALQPFQEVTKNNPNLSLPGDRLTSETIKPNVFVIHNKFRKDIQNRVFFRLQDYDKAIDWLASFVEKFEVNCHIEGILIGENKQLPCVITGTISQVSPEKEIFVNIWDAFNPLNPLDDESKEWLTREWTIQISPKGTNKVHPKYLLFEIGEELAISKQVLNVQDIAVTLGGRTIIRDVSFNVQREEILGIIGESGSGKSTTLKCILGEFNYEGSISVFGIDGRNTKGISPFIGYVPQDLSRMYENFNVLENIVAFGRQYGLLDDLLIQRGKKIIKDLGIDHVANQPVSSLSGGQKRRASIAIAMVHNPRLLFLDEPTSGLDPLARYELWDYLDLINKDYGITLVVISHYLDEIEYCDKACIFLRGIGFYDFNTPRGLKQNLPGKGLALEVVLEKVTVEAVEYLQKIEGVIFVIQRGERIRLLSNLPSQILSKKVMAVLNNHEIKVHSLELKVEVDMVDYFTYVSMMHHQQGDDKQTGQLTKKELQQVIQKNIPEENTTQGFLPFKNQEQEKNRDEEGKERIPTKGDFE